MSQQEPNVFEEDDDDKPSQGWLVTFSDLLSLLLCFFCCAAINRRF